MSHVTANLYTSTLYTQTRRGISYEGKARPSEGSENCTPNLHPWTTVVTQHRRRSWCKIVCK